MRIRNFLVVVLGLALFSCISVYAFAQGNQTSQQGVSPEGQVISMEPTTEVATPMEGAEVVKPEAEEAKPELITLDFKEADIRDVLKVISYKSGVNIVSSPEVAGTVNVRITDVPWERALDVILKTYGYAYDKQDKIIMVAPLEKLTAQRKMEQDLAQVQPTVTEVVELKYIDAVDAKKAIEAQLSPRGRVTILEVTGQSGWGFGGTFREKRARGTEVKSRSRTLIVSDIPPVLDQIRKVLTKIDIKPKLILIETRLVEVNRNKLKDIGVDVATGGSGSATNPTTSPLSVNTDSITKDLNVGGRSIANVVSPAIFGPQASTITSANTGMQIVFQKLTGTNFEVLFHALEENIATNTLSAPSVLTLDNQEATILVGEQFPIINTTVSSDTANTVGVSLEEYKDIGIQLNVVPQVSGKNRDYINMIVHPAVTTEGSLIDSKYPRITTREAQTQVLIKSGDTIMIGGLIKDVKSEGVQGVPYLRKIPFIGKLFQRTTHDTEKIELLIFITATIVDDKNLTSEQLATLEERLNLRSSQN